MSESKPTAEFYKNEGNQAFKNNDYNLALQYYSDALRIVDQNDKNLRSMLHSNKAMCYLKQLQYQQAIEECNASLYNNSDSIKSLYRLAQAYLGLNEFNSASNTLTRLLRIDHKNIDGIKLMVELKKRQEENQLNNSAIGTILYSLQQEKITNESAIDGLRSLVYDDVNHAKDFGRLYGLQWLTKYISDILALETNQNNKMNHNSLDGVIKGLKLLHGLCSYEYFIHHYVDMTYDDDQMPESCHQNLFLYENKLSLYKLCQLMSHYDLHIVKIIVNIIVQIMKHCNQDEPLDPTLANAFNQRYMIPTTNDSDAPLHQAESKITSQSSNDSDFIPNSNQEEIIEIISKGAAKLDQMEKHQQKMASNEDVEDIKATLKTLKQTISNVKNPKNTTTTSDKKSDRKRFENVNYVGFHEHTARQMLQGFIIALNHLYEHKNDHQMKDHDNDYVETFIVIHAALTAFLSEVHHYISDHDVKTAPLDTRYESTEDRKKRFKLTKEMQYRAYRHITWAIEEGLIQSIINYIDDDNKRVHQEAMNALGRIVYVTESDDVIKANLLPLLISEDDPMNDNSTDSCVSLTTRVYKHPIELCRKRASIECALYISSKPELAVWALDQPKQGEGVRQLLRLVVSGDERCQAIAAEVMCLASSSDANTMLSPIVASGALNILLKSPNQTIRAAAAATMTKLSIKAKAFKEDSSELTEILNTVVGVLKAAANATKTADSKKTNDLTVQNASVEKSSSSEQINVERAIEVLAALVGKTHIKEEIVHGSYRVAASINFLAALDVDVNTHTTMTYGLAHCFAMLTVSNHELHQKALAEQNLTPEQYKQLNELQTIKTKDEAGNIIEEKKNDDILSDTDTDALVRIRIKRIVSANGLLLLTKLLQSPACSAQTKEITAKALRQICVEESVRGIFIQQGALKACTTTASEISYEKSLRRECAHAIAKCLVTTNPSMLSEHARLGAINPLVMLCKDVDSTNLQQFEACLSLTNLMSCGPSEIEKFVAEKGVSAVHYLMFSSHPLVQRAATEVLCNLPTHEAVLKMLRVPEKVRLWLALCEDWDGSDKLHHEEMQDPENGLKLSRAASGTLAMAAEDPEVTKALLSENVGSTIVNLLSSANAELVHRTIVLILQMMPNGGKKLGDHLVEHGVVRDLGVVSKLGSMQLAQLAVDASMAISKAIESS